VAKNSKWYKQCCLVFGLVICAHYATDLAQTQTINHADTNQNAQAINSARKAFELFKKLEGKWRGQSTKGWEEVINYKTIAQGSVVVGNSFDAHPNETMMTMFYLDGDRLMLTHYCVARNQPRLVATAFSEDGKTITFTYLDGTNLTSRNQGHMDKLVFRFVDENHAVSRWTWYQDGKERWLEEILLERIAMSQANEILN
jgi:hypothetical protein